MSTGVRTQSAVAPGWRGAPLAGDAEGRASQARVFLHRTPTTPRTGMSSRL